MRIRLVTAVLIPVALIVQGNAQAQTMRPADSSLSRVAAVQMTVSPQARTGAEMEDANQLGPLGFFLIVLILLLLTTTAAGEEPASP